MSFASFSLPTLPKRLPGPAQHLIQFCFALGWRIQQFAVSGGVGQVVALNGKECQASGLVDEGDVLERLLPQELERL